MTHKIMAVKAYAPNCICSNRFPADFEPETDDESSPVCCGEEPSVAVEPNPLATPESSGAFVPVAVLLLVLEATVAVPVVFTRVGSLAPQTMSVSQSSEQSGALGPQLATQAWTCHVHS